MKWATGLVFALGCALSAIGASAQVTNCYPNNPTMPAAGVHCDTIGGGNAVVTPSGGQNIFQYLHKRSENKKVGGMIADGKCDEARSEALRDGDLALAEHVQRLCSPTTRP